MESAYILGEDEVLITRTDPHGRITYANDAFLRVSLLSQEQALGKPQNVVRHPDMPPEVFADLWRTIGGGRPWSGLLKNRRSDGGHYWSKAQITPILDGGRATGHLCVRTRPQAAEVEAAAQLYERMRTGRLGGIALEGGEVVRTGLAGRLMRLLQWPIRVRIWLPLGAAAAASGLCALASLAWPATDAPVAPWLIAACGALGAVISMIAAWYISARIGDPLRAAAQCALRICGGDMGVRFEERGDAEMHRLARSLNHMNAKLIGVLKDANASIDMMRSATGEVASSNMDLSARTEQQSVSLQHTADSMEKLNSAVRQNAENARRVNDAASGATRAARAGGDTVGQVVETMQEIQVSSGRIADIISLIDSIAFQTNILALNAAVEAARAGEQGRGFAVVAGEVRRLAQSSAQAAAEIKGLISASVDKVERGSALVNEAGQTMRDIVAQVTHVTEAIEQIARATLEQSDGIDQLNHSVSELDQTTRRNTALVEENAAAAESLKQQADRLAEAVGIFQLCR